jgi:hypothetical protein
MSNDPAVLAQLEQLLVAIGGYPDPHRASAEWKQVYKVLQKTDLPAPEATHVVGMRDLAGLKAVIERLSAPEGTPPPAAAEVFDDDTLRKALHAFRKRMSLTVLDEESKLGYSPLTRGKDASVAAIRPPQEWPDALWQELVRQGRLRYIGHGFYEVPK